MLDSLKQTFTGKKARQLFDARNIGLYIFGLVVLAIAWSGARTVQSNYQLQRQIAAIKQQNQILWLQNDTIYLQNQYYNTDQYLELSARQNLGLAAPGEKVMLVPKNVALRYVNSNLAPITATASQPADKRPAYVKNLEAWRDFLLGRKTDS